MVYSEKVSMFNSLVSELDCMRKEYVNIQSIYPPESEYLINRLDYLKKETSRLRKEVDNLYIELKETVVEKPRKGFKFLFKLLKRTGS